MTATEVSELASVGSALRAAVDRLEPSTWAVAAYHFGWTDADGRLSGTDPAGGGKGVRARLALLSARAAGAPADVGLPGAVAVELLHNFSLVHDDVMDGDVQRRHRRTVWAVFGVPAAILTGSALQALALEMVLDPPTPAGAAAARLLARTTRELVGGQFSDLEFERRAAVTVAECEAMAAGKTGALLVCSATVGAVLAGAAPESGTVAALRRYGEHVGLAFQLEDDLLGIWGDPAVTGKPALADLRARKKSLPVAAALATGGPAAARLRAWLATPAPPAVPAVDDLDELRGIAELVQEAGGRGWVAAEARRQVVLAERALAGAPVDPGAAAELVDLARALLGRSA